MSTSKERVFVGLSGGVDSSVSALLLKEQGYAVEAVFMKNWEEDDTADYCAAEADLKDAEKVCSQLDIPLRTINFAAEYWDRVFEYFLETYQKGHTPNPDILCNREIKFKAFFDYAKAEGAKAIATGHYAQIGPNNSLSKGADLNKDQSYFLYAIDPNVLKHVYFPIGHLNKTEVRDLAKKAGFSTAHKKDSTGICFIGERKFNDFLKTYLPAQPGLIQTPEGKTLGEHQGLMFHTIGQRQGLHIGGRKDSLEQPWYVAKKDIPNNILTVVQGSEHRLLFKKRLSATQLTWLTDKPLPTNCHAKIRYRQVDQACKITYQEDNTRCQIEFNMPQRAVTPGQSIVFYQNNQCLGGGIIE